MKNKKIKITLFSLLLLLFLFIPSSKILAKETLFLHKDEVKAFIKEINTDFEATSDTNLETKEVYLKGNFIKKDDVQDNIETTVFFLDKNKQEIASCTKKMVISLGDNNPYYCGVNESNFKNNTKLSDVYYYTITYKVNNKQDYSNYKYVLNKYHVDINVSETNVYRITENINAYFNEPRHGIFRTIPLRNRVMRVDGSSYTNRARITNIKVNHDYKRSRENNNLKLRIGSSDKTLTGEEKYTISYDYSLRNNEKSKDYDEFYFNIIGPEWDTIIDNISFTITMPKEFDKTKLGFSAGKRGSLQSENIHYEVNGNVITGTYIGALNPKEALTIRVELPEGYFIKVESKTSPLYKFIYLIPLVFLGLSFFLWRIFGKDDKVIETVEFYPPEGFNSLEVGYMYNGQACSEDVTSLLIYLANKGYIKITEIEEQALFTKSKGFKITKLKEYDGNDANERLFLNGLFAAAGSHSIFDKKESKENKLPEVTSSDLCDKFYVTNYQILRNVNSSTNKNKIFEKGISLKRFFIILMVILSFCIITIKPVLDFDGPDNLVLALLFPSIGFIILSIGLVGGSNIGNRRNSFITKFFFIIWGAMFGGIPWGMFVLPSIVGTPLYLYGYIFGLICILGMMICFQYLPKRTPYGNEMLGKIKGFKNFLETAEKDKLEAMVEQDPTYFYDILPFTYVLGVSDKWIKKFETISMQAPSWYDSPNAFDVVYFNSFINRTMASASIVMSSSPASSSPSTGGGFSGGGSGGGGGGSW